jgi:hypothetical protein
MRLQESPLLPFDTAPALKQALSKVLREIAVEVNQLAGGYIAAVHNASAAMPTTGAWTSGDFVRKDSYVEVDGGIAGYVVLGWLRLTDGSSNVAGTDWFEAQVPTGGYGWRDLVGYPTIYSIGANDPTWTTYRGNIKQYMFSQAVMNELWFTYHIDHDHKTGSDLYLHAHWSQITVDTGGTAGAPGDVKWYFDVTYAKGHQQMAFAAPITTSVVQTASSTQYMHNIAEVQLSATSPSGSQLDSDDIQTDGLILVRIYRDAADGADSLNQNPFLHTVDLHYQADHMTTPNKAFPFT